MILAKFPRGFAAYFDRLLTVPIPHRIIASLFLSSACCVVAYLPRDLSGSSGQDDYCCAPPTL